MHENIVENIATTIAAVDFTAAGSLKRGREAFDKGDYSGAAGLFSLALMGEPTNLEALRLRAEAHFRLEKYQDAFNDASQALSVDPDDQPTLFRRGVILAMHGNLDESLVDLTRLLRLDPDHVEGRLRRFWVFMQLRQLHAAEEDLRHLLIVLPEETPIQTMAVHMFLQAGQIQPANTVLTRILDREPENVEMLKLRGIVWRHLGAPDMAVDDFSRAMDVDGPTAELLAERAVALVEVGRRTLTNKAYNRAVYDFTWVLEEMADQLSDTAPIFNHRAKAWELIAARNWFDKSGYQKAIADYTDAVTKNPEYVEALFHRASLHWKLGNVEETQSDCHRIIELKSDHTDALHLRAETYLKMKEPEKAEADFQAIDRLHEIHAQQHSQQLEENRSACDSLDCSRFCRH